jgi:hypothetical protein
VRSRARGGGGGGGEGEGGVREGGREGGREGEGRKKNSVYRAHLLEKAPVIQAADFSLILEGIPIPQSSEWRTEPEHSDPLQLREKEAVLENIFVQQRQKFYFVSHQQ